MFAKDKSNNIMIMLFSSHNRKLRNKSHLQNQWLMMMIFLDNKIHGDAIEINYFL